MSEIFDVKIFRLKKTHFFQRKVTVLPYLYALYSEGTFQRALRKGLALPDKYKDSGNQALMRLMRA